MLKNQEYAKEILYMIKQLIKESEYMYECVVQEKYELIECIGNEFISLGERFYIIFEKLREEVPFALADKRCENFIYSTISIMKLVRIRSDRVKAKVEFELLSILKGLLDDFYFFACVDGDLEKEELYYREEFSKADSSPYVEKSIEKGSYKYDVTIVICAYNKIEYTQHCIESIIKYTPSYLKYELVILNNGSSDETQTYFQSLKCAKEIKFKKNIRSSKGIHYIFEGEYVLGVSNDVIVTENYLDNLLKCIKSDSKIAMVVPVTSNISNFQSVHAKYTSLEEMHKFSKKYNVSNPMLWEERTRLCNPICLYKSEILLSSKGVGIADKVFVYSEFTDDALSLRLRRAGYKMILAKDCYCHHFGSITLKDAQIKENTLEKSREIFKKRYGVDAWGVGFCYDSKLIELLNIKHNQLEINILGINSGFGSNPLKIKNMHKELYNVNCNLYYATDDVRYIDDLKLYSKEAKFYSENIINAYDEIKNSFDYIIVEDNSSNIIKNEYSIERLKRKLNEQGCIVIWAKDEEESKLFELLKPHKHKKGNIGEWFLWIN